LESHPKNQHAHLPRLVGAAYRGLAMVHWTMTLADRAAQEPDEAYHARFRELLLHTAIRYDVLYPAYCLMIDHLHVLAVGTVEAGSDQKLAMTFLRRHLNELLATRYRARLQKQAYDNVLREKERERGAFQVVAFYILENPVRKGLAASADQWGFSGCMVPGHPSWNVFHPEYWPCFWKAYEKAIEAGRR
jgi:putative transposase